MADVKFSFKPWRYKRFRSPSSEVGSRVKVKYSSKYDENGNIVLVEVGTEDVYDYIQSFAASVDINNIMQRFNGGDSSALLKVQGVYGDFSDVPDNWSDVLNVLNEGRMNFDRAPKEFKEQFGNDFSRFVSLGGIAPDNPTDIPVATAPVVPVDEKQVTDES